MVDRDEVWFTLYNPFNAYIFLWDIAVNPLKGWYYRLFACTILIYFQIILTTF